ncbi:hypothetical protein D3C78_1168330 [compost metagenome]
MVVLAAAVASAAFFGSPVSGNQCEVAVFLKAVLLDALTQPGGKVASHFEVGMQLTGVADVGGRATYLASEDANQRASIIAASGNCGSIHLVILSQVLTLEALASDPRWGLFIFRPWPASAVSLAT